jgi:hypothetical protein
LLNWPWTVLGGEDTLYWFHWNNSLQISWSTLTHYTDSTETTVYRYLVPLWHIILTPLKQQSTDILVHSDTLYWFHWNNSLQISCSTLTHYTDSTETTVYDLFLWSQYNVSKLTKIYVDCCFSEVSIMCQSGARYL